MSPLQLNPAPHVIGTCLVWRKWQGGRNSNRTICTERSDENPLFDVSLREMNDNFAPLDSTFFVGVGFCFVLACEDIRATELLLYKNPSNSAVGGLDIGR